MTFEKYILAIITNDSERVIAASTPVFVAKSDNEMQRTAFLLEKILDGVAHDLENGTLIIVRH